MNSDSTPTSRRLTKTINRDWKFHYSPEPEPKPEFREADYNDTDWRAIAVPHTWNTYESTGQLHPFIRDPAETDSPHWWHGWGCYRKWLVLGTELKGRRLFVEFDGVQKYSRIWCNGRLAGQHKGGFTSFSVDITNHVRLGKSNLLAVEVSNRRDDQFGGIPPMTAGNWNLYGGIYREVRMVVTDSLHVPFQGSFEHEGGTFVTTPQVNQKEAVATIKTYLRNTAEKTTQCLLKTTIVDPRGQVVEEMRDQLEVEPGQLIECVQTSRPMQPYLWSPETPELYRVVTLVQHDQKMTDHYCSPLGFRWFNWDYDEKVLYLNGRKIHIHGTNRHQEYPWLGDAIPKWLHRKDLNDIKFNLGHNFMRTCHYPQDRLVYQLCDRWGIVVCEEVPNIKNIEFSDQVQRQNVIEMIRRDRNHPSIVMWSIGNETDHAADGNWVRAEDSSRIVHCRKALGRGEDEKHDHHQIDMENLLRCTIRGWPVLPPDQGPALEDHENGQITGSEEWQHAMARREGGSIRGRIDYNTVVWLYADHGADREYRNCPLLHVNPKGWVDPYRHPKYMYYLWQANYAPEPMVFIHPHRWRSQHLGERHDIVVDSNCDQVELFCGNRKLGIRHPGADNFHTVVFPNVPVENRTLRAVASRQGQAIVHELPMAGEPAALQLTTSHRQIIADRAGIALVTVVIVDKQGTIVPGADNELNWRISGPGLLIGPERFLSDSHKREESEGTMYITTPVTMPIRSTAQPGIIEVSVHSPGLAGASAAIASLALDEARLPGLLEPTVGEPPSQQILTGKTEARVEPTAPAVAGNQLAIVYEDIHLTPGQSGYRAAIDKFIRTRNPDLESDQHYARLVSELTELLEKNQGHLIADDYNFAILKFNRQQS